MNHGHFLIESVQHSLIHFMIAQQFPKPEDLFFFKLGTQCCCIDKALAYFYHRCLHYRYVEKDLQFSREKLHLRLPGTYDAKIDENQTPLTRFPE